MDHRKVQRDLYAAYKAGALSYPPGWHDARLRSICEGRCGDYGEPACWRLPSLSSDCDPADVTPCDECIGDLTSPPA